uniref:DUF3592 domain-containing protein n=1 Tax=Flavobacterium reichenbachii TaxID=362418 RepID=UPI0021CD48ED|nr:DUF3592 domain-containing protein [Flavobacterium reichenbachii]
MNNFLKRGCVGLFLLPFLLIGLGILSYSLCNLYKTEQANSWIQIPAYVEKIDLDIHTNDETTTYEVLVTYSYKIKGKKYLGNRIFFGYSGSNIENHEALYAKLKNSRKIMIYVNPNKNQEAVIVPGINYPIIWLLIFAVFWISFFGIFSLPLFIKDVHNNPRFSYKKTALVLGFICVVSFIVLLSGWLHFGIENKINVL